MALTCKSVKISDAISYCMLQDESNPIEIIFKAHDTEYRTKKHSLKDAECWITQNLNKFTEQKE